MQWSSKELYENRLVAHDDVKDRSVLDLMNKDKIQNGSDLSTNPLLIIDTAGSQMQESIEGGGEEGKKSLTESKSNDGEADLVIQVITELSNDLGIQYGDIGVITPYSAQVNLIKKLLKSSNISKVEVSTVDGF